MPRVIHFELAADNPERATEFYKNVFGWQIQKWDGPQDYWLATTGARMRPALMARSFRFSIAAASD